MNLDGVDTRGLGAPALAFERIPELRIVGVIAERREAIVEIACRPVADAVTNVEGFQEFQRLRAIKRSAQ